MRYQHSLEARFTPTMAGARLYLLHDPSMDTALAIQIDDAAGGGSDFGDERPGTPQPAL